MAHRRALTQPRGWVPWLLVPIALALDGATVLGLAGHRLPLGLAIPDAVLVAAPLLVYGGLAFAVFRTRPVSVRLAVLATLLCLHAGLVGLHALLFASVWSLPAPAALRLAHRWSPLIPLLQLVWVPLLALPLVGLALPRAPATSRRRGTTATRRDVLGSHGAHTGQRGRLAPDRDLAVEPGERAGGSLAALEAPEALAHPVSSAPPIPAPPVAPTPPPIAPAIGRPDTPAVPGVHDLDGAVVASLAPAPTDAVPMIASGEARVAPAELPAAAAVVDDAVTPVEEESPPASQLAIPVAVAPIDAVLRLGGTPPEPESPRAVDAPPVLGVLAGPPALPTIPPRPVAPSPPVVATAPPLDPYVVAGLFEPYGPLLSRDGAVLVDWTPGPEASVVCVAPQGIARERVVRLAGRVARALAGAGHPSASPRVRRVSLRGPDGVAVLTPVDGGILVAASSRAGAAALLEILSARVVPGPVGGDGSPGDSGGASESREARVADAVRVETPAASLDVLTPTGVDAAPLAELAGRLLAAVADEGTDRLLHTLSVDLGAQRLMVHPVDPHARPPRFAAVVGGRDRPGVLGRRAERAARTLREVS